MGMDIEAGLEEQDLHNPCSQAPEGFLGNRENFKAHYSQ
jgi:hypothetical protein